MADVLTNDFKNLFLKGLQKREEEKKQEKLEKAKALIKKDNNYDKNCKIIYKALKSTSPIIKKIVDKNDNFVIWLNEPELKISNPTFSDIESLAKKCPMMFYGKSFADFRVRLYHNTHGKKISDPYPVDTWAACHIRIYTMASDGKILPCVKHADFIWTTEDFKVTTITYRFIKFIMRVVNKGIYNSKTRNTTVTEMVKEIKEKKIDFRDILEPLL